MKLRICVLSWGNVRVNGSVCFKYLCKEKVMIKLTKLVIMQTTIFFVIGSVANAVEQYEKFDYFGIEIRMHNVEACGSRNNIAVQDDGYLCYFLPSKNNNASPFEHGCLKKVVYESGRGDIIRTGFWFDWNEARQAAEVQLYGAKGWPKSEGLAGPTLYFNNDGYIELNGDDPAPEFVTACRISGPSPD